MDCDIFEEVLQTQLQESDPTTGEDIDELEDERDSLAATLEFDEQMTDPGSELRGIAQPQGPATKAARTTVKLANAAVAKASEQVVVKSTLDEYNRYLSLKFNSSISNSS